MGMDEVCTQGLILGLGFPPAPGTPSKIGEKSNLGPPNGFDIDPCLTLALSGETCYHEAKERAFDTHGSSFNEESGGGCGQAASSQHSGASSFSCGKAVKREREASSDDNEIERVSSKVSNEDDDLGGVANTLRKKLRLTKDQSALLEESFKEHITLNPKQKQALARQLNLRPRQVEVWFQNRRARTKLKQTEVDCEFLKKCCERLNDENQRLKKELQELKALKLGQPLYMHVGGATTLTMCPSCERVCGGGGGDDKSPKSQFSMAQTTKPHFYAHQFTNPFATCGN